MTDFTNIVNIDLPEGEIIKITDSNNNLIWSKCVTVTINVKINWGWMSSADICYGNAYIIAQDRGKWGQLEQEDTSYTLRLPIGTVLYCVANYDEDLEEGGNIYLNGACVTNGEHNSATSTYQYIVTRDVKIDLTNGGDYYEAYMQSGKFRTYGEISITEN